MQRKIIIDTDPGIDDAMAISFALKSPELDVMGITTVHGNVAVDLATTNALRLLEIADRFDVPVARGASHPLTGSFHGAVPHIHGADGQGNLNLAEPTSQPIPESAPEFIIEQVMSFPGEITLVPIGPLTNLAIALHLEPKIAKNVQEVVLMGGNALVSGNASPAAEANIWHDPEAADLVFGAGWPVTMVGLDVTHKVIMTREHLERYHQCDEPLAQHIARMMPIYYQFNRETYGIDGIHVHDSTAIAYLLAPDAFQTQQCPVRVETHGLGRGKTWPCFGNTGNRDPWANRAKATICVNVDAERTIALELGRVAPQPEETN